MPSGSKVSISFHGPLRTTLTGHAGRMLVVVREMPEERLAAERAFAGQQRLQVHAIQMLIRPQRQPGRGKAGRIQVRADDRLGADPARLGDAGPLDDQRHADAAFVIGALVGPQRRVAGGVVEAAVVAR